MCYERKINKTWNLKQAGMSLPARAYHKMYSFSVPRLVITINFVTTWYFPFLINSVLTTTALFRLYPGWLDHIASTYTGQWNWLLTRLKSICCSVEEPQIWVLHQGTITQTIIMMGNPVSAHITLRLKLTRIIYCIPLILDLILFLKF